MRNKVLVLDFGSQYTQLIARRVRELGVLSEIKPCHTDPLKIDKSVLGAIILSGGPASANEQDAPKFDAKWLELGVPVLGVCYGVQLMAHLLGGKLGQGEAREYGYATLRVREPSELFYGFDCNETTAVWMSHGDHINAMPPGFKLLASTDSVEVAAMADQAKKLYGIQFHAEVVHTPRGNEILANFLFKICGLSKNWSPADIIARSIDEISAQVAPKSNVVCGLSGGVDSTVAAYLVSKALGPRLHCIFVDNGLLRKDEAKEVISNLDKAGLGLNVKLIDAGARFIKALSGVTDPEEKRKIIGRVFIEVFDEEAHRISNVTHLVQGTLYPDVIESVSVRGPSATIKTHHNVGGLPERMKLKLIEPFRELFKDEVRALAKAMNMDEEVIQRQPFPGPGLAVRVLGEINSERLEVLRQADYIFSEEVRAFGLYNELWQAFCVLLPIKSVGVMGDFRTYEQTVVLRAVRSEDGMTADWAYLPEELLKRVSNRIINEVRGINRVVLDISSKPPATIEWE